MPWPGRLFLTHRSRGHTLFARPHIPAHFRTTIPTGTICTHPPCALFPPRRIPPAITLRRIRLQWPRRRPPPSRRKPDDARSLCFCPPPRRPPVLVSTAPARGRIHRRGIGTSPRTIDIGALCYCAVHRVVTKRTPSGGFLDSPSRDSVSPALWGYLCPGGVVPNSACGDVCVQPEQVVETGLGGVHLREHAPSARPAPVALVEKDGLFDSSQV